MPAFKDKKSGKWFAKFYYRDWQGSNIQKWKRVGTQQYLDYYDYVLDMGFNPEAIPGQGSALFLHCEGDYWVSSSGCVAVPREQMESIMKLYGTWGEDRCFIALAPGGTFEAVYDTYGTNHGLSPADYEEKAGKTR